MTKDESERVEEIWNEYFRKNIDIDPYDFGTPRVGPNVDGYCVYPGIITGHVSELLRIEGDDLSYEPIEKKCRKPGYFIIDTHVNKIYRGLSKQEWRTRLRKFGVNHEPKLFKPSRFDKYFGRNKPQSLSD
jgi:hypothetical protein